MRARFRRKLCSLPLVVCVLVPCVGWRAHAQRLSGVNDAANRKFVDQKGKRQNLPQNKLGGSLNGLLNAPPAANGKSARTADPARLDPTTRVFGDSVAIEAVARTDAQALLTKLRALGLKKPTVRGRVVGGLLPIANLAALANVPGLAFARQSTWINHVGKTTSQGLQALRAHLSPIVPRLDGSGVTVGVISDSYNCLGGAPGDTTSNDLPPHVTVLDDSLCPSGTDEGRAMMELIHDVAPGANLVFHSLGVDQPALASAIRNLREAGASVIVDDALFLAEPMFQDGIVAQAVDDVVASGTVYFSAAGNAGRNSFDDNYAASGQFGLLGERHDFDPGPGIDTLLNFMLQPGETIFVMQWQNPSFSVSGSGADSDMDILLNDPNGAFTGFGSFNYNIGNDPFEMFGVVNNGPPIELTLSIERFVGPPPGLFKIVAFNDFPVLDFPTFSSTIYGHPNAASAMAIGAAPYFGTPAFGITPALLEPYSSAGGTPILFDRSGNAIAAVIRKKPDLVAPDGGNTTFFGFDLEPDGYPNFFGTSGAASHAAAAAALLKQQRPTLVSASMKSFLTSTALDMTIPGFDFDSGFGLMRADFAVAAVQADVDRDGVVDRDDVALIRSGFGGNNMAFDVNGDGAVNVLDQRSATNLCTKAGCAP